MTIRVLSKGVRALSIPLFLALLVIATGCSQSSDAVLIDNDDIGGTVEGQNGPEAGVWVIAETTDLPTKFSRTVVTDGQGRFVCSQLDRIGGVVDGWRGGR